MKYINCPLFKPTAPKKGQAIVDWLSQLQLEMDSYGAKTKNKRCYDELKRYYAHIHTSYSKEVYKGRVKREIDAYYNTINNNKRLVALNDDDSGDFDYATSCTNISTLSENQQKLCSAVEAMNIPIFKDAAYARDDRLVKKAALIKNKATKTAADSLLELLMDFVAFYSGKKYGPANFSKAFCEGILKGTYDVTKVPPCFQKDTKTPFYNMDHYFSGDGKQYVDTLFEEAGQLTLFCTNDFLPPILELLGLKGASDVCPFWTDLAGGLFPTGETINPGIQIFNFQESFFTIAKRIEDALDIIIEAEKPWIMAYYGQWNTYAANFPVPLEADYYENITHFAYGFMGFNAKGEIGTWDAWADFSGAKPAAQYIDSENTFITSLQKAAKLTGLPNKTQQFARMAYAKHNFKKKNIMSIGGWQYDNAKAGMAKSDAAWGSGQSPAEVFYTIASDNAKLTKFVKQIVGFIKYTKYKMACKGANGVCTSSTDTIESLPMLFSTPNTDLTEADTITSPLPNGYTWDPNAGDAFTLFDGVDIDWEYPAGCEACASCDPDTTGCSGNWTPKDDDKVKSVNFYASLLNKLKLGLGAELLVTTTVGGDPAKINNLFTTSKVEPTVKTAFNAIDRVSIMSYDYMNGNNVAMHNAPLFAQTSDGTGKWNTNDAVTAMTKGGVPSAKINIGAPFYGRFQFVTADTINKLIADSNEETLSNNLLNDTKFYTPLFNGKTEALYWACSQDTTHMTKDVPPKGIPCNWPFGKDSGTTKETDYTIEINTVGYDMESFNVTDPSCSKGRSSGCVFPSCGVCGTRIPQQPSSCPPNDGKSGHDPTWVSQKCCMNNNGNNDLCSFESGLKKKFYSGWDDDKKVSYYISINTIKPANSPTTGKNLKGDVINYTQDECYILLSMPSKDSVEAKAKYVTGAQKGAPKDGVGGIITWMSATDVKHELAKLISDVIYPPTS